MDSGERSTGGERMSKPISAADAYERHRIAFLETEISYVDTGAGEPVVFLHGNPTSSYLWRNVIPHVEGLGRCLAPDLVGMGDSGAAPDGSYRFVDHARYLDAWFEALGLTNVTLVVHDWGSALGFYWAYRHPERVRGIAYMEAVVRPLTWEEWRDESRQIFQDLRSEAGEEMVLEKNLFIEGILPSAVLRDLTEEEMNVYRRPYLEPGESRRPTLTWPRELPINGEPEDVVSIVDDYSKWLAQSDVPKLFVNAEPGVILTGSQREFCRTWPNQEEVTVRGAHFVQEDSPHEIGEAVDTFVRRTEGAWPPPSFTLNLPLQAATVLILWVALLGDCLQLALVVPDALGERADRLQDGSERRQKRLGDVPRRSVVEAPGRALGQAGPEGLDCSSEVVH